METVIVGLDIGGTYVKIGVFDREAELIDRWQLKTVEDGKVLVEYIWNSIQSNLPSEFNCEGIGIGIPGFIDYKNKTIIEAVNMRLYNFNIEEEFKKYTNIPVFIENDANVAALGEFWKESGDIADMTLITLGTGVGSGIISDSEIFRGKKGLTGEIGHCIIDVDGYKCNCGRHGCLDTIASATGIVKAALEQPIGDSLELLDGQEKTRRNLVAEDVFFLAKNGNKHCRSVITHAVDSLGLALANYAAIMNPEKILIGGGLADAGQEFIDAIAQAFHDKALNEVSKNTIISKARLGNDAGITGAAYLVCKNNQITVKDINKAQHL